jgi:2-polyprenyl-3-methyl-5-hydroxy-6-metoxy-1,4-benzoquinol methylase
MIDFAQQLSPTTTRDRSHCQLCAGDLEAFVVPGRLSLWRCTACGLYQNGEMPPSEAYEGDYHAGYSRKREAKLRTATIRINRIARLIKAKPNSAFRLLDIGASVGCTLEAAKNRGWRAEGVDVSEQAVEYCCSLGLECRAIDGECLPFDDDRFDVVTAWHVIEHVRDVRETLAEWRRVLRPGGVLALETPDAECLKVRRRGAAYTRFWAPEHTYTFTRATLVEFVRQAGFEILKAPFTGKLSDLSPSLAAYAGLYQSHVAVRTALGVHKAFQIFARRL